MQRAACSLHAEGDRRTSDRDDTLSTSDDGCLRGALAFFLCWQGVAAFALDLRLPGNAMLMREQVTGAGHLDLPTGATVEGWLPSRPHEGQLTEQAWRIEAADLTTLQILAPLREQLLLDDWEIVFECATDECGGFDFRRAVNVLPPPEMFVSLSDFRWLSALRRDEALTLMVSRTEDAGFVQITRAGPALGEKSMGNPAAPVMAATAGRVSVGEAPVDPAGFVAVLESEGRVILSDLAFETGSAALAEGSYASLAILAEYLRDNPERRLALVGHTDSEGSLEANIALSKRRAWSVMERLVSAHNVARAQVDAEGMGYLAPVASNLTPEGREANRRVEAVLLSTQ